MLSRAKEKEVERARRLKNFDRDLENKYKVIFERRYRSMSVRPRVSKARASKSTQRKKKLEDASGEDSEDATKY